MQNAYGRQNEVPKQKGSQRITLKPDIFWWGILVSNQ